MPAPASVPEFLDLVRKSGLLAEIALDEFLDRHRSAGTLPTAIDPFAAGLVRDGLLTFFQAKQLKLGRYKRFTIGSKYKLLELIGAGGMGAVYLCEHMLMRRLVALKVLPVEKLEDPSNLERFHREARAVGALDHPNIVRAYDIDHHEKLHFLVMEYVDGNSLQEIVARQGAMDRVRAAHYIAQAAVGLQHAHALGMVHRDIKPANLLLERTGVIKLLDMGLARFFNKPTDSVTEKYDEKCILGTADYLAPEQARSNTVDVRADIYSLGATLYFLLTGRTPFPDGSITAKLLGHQSREPEPVERFRPDVPPAMAAVLRRMMAKEPNHRYQEPIEVAEALAEWADLPIDAPPAHEMPGLCPLVLSLTGHSADRLNNSSSTVPLGRVLFGPGRSVLRAANGSSGRHNAIGSQTSTASRPGGRGSGVRKSAGPISTRRSAAAPTRPMARQPEKAERDGQDQGEPSARPKTKLYFTVAALVGLLFAAVLAITAFYLGRANREPTSAGSSPILSAIRSSD
jgi:serine/threonine protein kinase